MRHLDRPEFNRKAEGLLESHDGSNLEGDELPR
jgi:hypothetical protein